jgi:ABC transporter with metal-binding/Fe-S-binding domain ATP-binding protein
MKMAVLYSGGKDSNFSAYLASKAGHEMSCLVSVIPETEESYMFHYPNVHLTNLQATAMGVPHIVGETEGKKEEELEDLRDLLLEAKNRHGVKGVVTGAVASVYQKSRVERVCSEIRLESMSPLWGVEPTGYMRALIRTGFEVVVVGISALGLDRTWLGRTLDSDMIEELVDLNERYGLHIAFEGGEAETFVLDSPLFSRRIRILESELEWKGDRGRLNIKEAELMDKRREEKRKGVE